MIASQNIGKIQRAQNEALMIITSSHKMSSIDHLHSETNILQVEDHLDTGNVCHHITKMELTIFTRHQTVLLLLANNRNDTPGTSHLICQYSNRQHAG